MTNTDERRYAALVADMVNVQPGQNVIIRTEAGHADFAAAVGRAAYERGAAYVMADVSIPGLYKNRLEASREDYLDYLPDFITHKNQRLVDEGWAFISIKNPVDPDFLADVDQNRNARVNRVISRTREMIRRSLQADRQQWIVVAHPTEQWAAKVLGTQAGPEALNELWSRMKPILRLDHENPSAAWRDRAALIRNRSETLQNLSLRALHFEAQGSDLHVGIPEHALWAGGDAERPDGVRFMPNLPTEEVFTTPHFEHTEGTVRVTRPALVLGRVVEGAWFRFTGGQVVDFGADSGRDVLEHYLQIDAGARRLGEIALVDAGSPIFTADTVFFNTLFDENAACHFALGSSYSACMIGGAEMSTEELQAAGGNSSLVHTDFMLGTADINVTGTRADGRSVPIIRDGSFVI
jgi:aminopeptidase